MDVENQSHHSLNWKKPSDVMQNFRKKRKALQNRIQNNTISKNKTNFKISTNALATNLFNPFRKNSIDESHSSSSPSVLELSSDTTLFQLLHPEHCVPTEVPDKPIKIELTELCNDRRSPEKELEPTGEKDFPMDWSLKTRLRFLSSSPLPWNATALKTTEEASGTTGFVRCLHSHQGELDTSVSAQLHQQCLVWQHPSLPWLSLFPRQNQPLSGSGIINAKIQQTLFNDWCNSVRSLFQLLRSRQCPYFYICAPSFTVLFRSAGVGGISEVNAMITPTTKGLRQSLKEEGVEYSMPLFNKQSDSNQEAKEVSSPKKASESNETLKKDVDETDDEMDMWMSNAGLESTQFLSSQRKQSQEDQPIDNYPESLVYVEGAEVQALYNFLLNIPRLCTTPTGPSAGVPATLLAPVAFQGGTLKSLTVKQNKVYKDRESLHCLDLHGPILPHVPHMLALLCRPSITSSYTMKFNTLQQTVPFSTRITIPFVPSAFAKQSLMDCGIHPDLLGSFCSAKKCQTMDEIVYNKGLFTWR